MNKQVLRLHLIDMGMKRRKIDKMIEPQFSSEVGGIRWYRSLTPADATIAGPFIALEYFRNNHLAGEKPQPTSRNYRGVKLFSHMIHGKYSVRINQSKVIQAEAGDFVEIDTGVETQLEEIYMPEGGKIEGFRLWIDENSDQSPRMNVAVHTGNEKRLRLQQGNVQVRFFSDFLTDQEDISILNDADLRILDVKVLANTTFEMQTSQEHHLLAFVYQGRGYFGPYQDEEEFLISRQRVLLFGTGSILRIQTIDTPISFLLVTAKPSQRKQAYLKTGVFDAMET